MPEEEMTDVEEAEFLKELKSFREALAKIPPRVQLQILDVLLEGTMKAIQAEKNISHH